MLHRSYHCLFFLFCTLTGCWTACSSPPAPSAPEAALPAPPIALDDAGIEARALAAMDTAARERLQHFLVKEYEGYTQFYRSPPVVPHVAVAPESAGAYGGFVDYRVVLDTAPWPVRLTARIARDTAGWPGIEVLCFVPRHYYADSATLSLYLSEHHVLAADGVQWYDLSEDRHAVDHGAPPSLEGHPELPRAGGAVSVPTSEYLHRRFYWLQPSIVLPWPFAGSIKVELMRSTHVPVALFDRSEVGQTKRGPYGTVTLWDIDQQRVYLKHDWEETWSSLSLQPMNTQGQLLLPQDPTTAPLSICYPTSVPYDRLLRTQPDLETFCREMRPHVAALWGDSAYLKKHGGLTVFSTTFSNPEVVGVFAEYEHSTTQLVDVEVRPYE